MCGRYYVDDETAKAIEALVHEIDKDYDKSKLFKDVYPTSQSVVLEPGSQGIRAGWQRWGFPGFQNKGVIFNARSETAMEKTMFKDSIKHRRCIVPAAWFYEWDKDKNKSVFYRKNSPVIYMAGCFKQFEDGNHYVVLTAAANESMIKIHDRMPVILEPEELSQWLFDDSRAFDILHRKQVLLERRSEFEQQRFSFDL